MFDATHRGLHYNISVEGSGGGGEEDGEEEMVVVGVGGCIKTQTPFTFLPFLTSPLQHTRAFSRGLAEIDCGQFTNILQA